MTPEIKERIEQIKCGEVPEGYKKTKIGITPSEWTTFQLGDIYTERKEKGNRELPILTVSIHSGVSDGALNEKEIGKKVKRIEDKTQYKKAISGDLVFNMMRAWQGAIGVVRTDGMVSPAYIVAVPNSKVYPQFMDDYMKTPQMINTIHRKSYGVMDFRLRLYWDSFSPITCSIPCIAEQKKIAEILAMQDKVIKLKEQRIAEKQRQKKYLMQQLLTGEKRLPGFDGVWKEKQFGNVLSFLSTNNFSRNDMNNENGTVQNIHYGDVLIKFMEVIDCIKTTLPYLNNDCLYKTMLFARSGDVVIADTAEDSTAGKAVELRNVTHKIVSGLHTMLCRPAKGIFSSGWLGYFINSDVYHKQLIPLITGAKVSGISKRNIINTKILIPTFDEQAAIVKVLSVAVREIELLQKELEAEKQMKKSLMQLLLMGIVRANV